MYIYVYVYDDCVCARAYTPSLDVVVLNVACSRLYSGFSELKLYGRVCRGRQTWTNSSGHDVGAFFLGTSFASSVAFFRAIAKACVCVCVCACVCVHVCVCVCMRERGGGT